MKSEYEGRDLKVKLITIILVMVIAPSIVPRGNAQALKWSADSAGGGATGVALDKTGLYVAGWDTISGSWAWRIEKRSLLDGSVIWFQRSNPTPGDDTALGIAVDDSGIYVVGWDAPGSNREWRIEKRDPADGRLIWTQTANLGSQGTAAAAVAVDAGGIYVVGAVFQQNVAQWKVEKRNADTGSIIWTQTATDVQGVPTAIAVYVSHLYIAGADYSGNGGEWRIEKRFTADGKLVPDFGASGVVQEDRTPAFDSAYAIAVDSRGIYLAGDQSEPENPTWVYEIRLLDGGSLKWGIIGRRGQASGTAVQKEYIYTCGWIGQSDKYQWMIEKSQTAGLSAVWSSGSSSEGSTARALAVDSTGLYVAGWSSGAWRIESIETDTSSQSTSSQAISTGISASTVQGLATMTSTATMTSIDFGSTLVVGMAGLIVGIVAIYMGFKRSRHPKLQDEETKVY